jgi:hypothetical protein
VFKSDIFELCSGLALIMVVACLCLWAFAPKEDTAKEVMQACANTGMYLHKGYAISCRVLVDAPHDAKEVKI